MTNPRTQTSQRQVLPRSIVLVSSHPAQTGTQTRRPRDLPRHINRETNQPALGRLIRTVRLALPNDLVNRSHKKILIKPRRRTSVLPNQKMTNSKSQIGTTRTTQPRTWRTWSCLTNSQMFNPKTINLRVQVPVRVRLRKKTLVAR